MEATEKDWVKPKLLLTPAAAPAQKEKKNLTLDML